MSNGDRPRYITKASSDREQHEPIPGSEVYSFCEAVTATGSSRWHIRKLDSVGRKTGGGITTPSLCGRVVPSVDGGMGGWDLDERVRITPHQLQHSACLRCMAGLLVALSKEPTAG